MGKISKDQRGFSALETVLILIVVGLIGFVGWYVYHAKNNTDKTLTQANSSSSSVKPQKTPKTTQSVALASNSVTFDMPLKWTFEKGSDKCRAFVTSNVTCIDGADISPDEKLATRYGNGTEFFHFSVSVFENKNNTDAKGWLLNEYQDGLPDSDDANSISKINGYNSYYVEKTYDGDGTSVREGYYVLVANEKSVVVYARTYEPGELSDGSKVGDFRKFEPQIKTIAESIKID